MYKKSILVIGLFALSAAISASAQTIYVNETFESYADTAAMNLNWNGNAGGVGTLDTGFGNLGQSARHQNTGANSDATVNRWTGSSFSLVPTSALDILLRADIFNPSGTDGRETVGLRNTESTIELFEMGHFNAAPVSQQYGARFVNMYGNPSWRAFTNAAGAVVTEVTTGTWDRFEALFTTTNATVTLDIGADGSIDGWIVAPVAHDIGVGLNNLRFGGPSGNSSTEAAWFDNIFLATVAPVPEPSTIALGAMGAVGCLVAYRRRK